MTKEKCFIVFNNRQDNGKYPESDEGSKGKEEKSIYLGDGLRWGLQAE